MGRSFETIIIDQDPSMKRALEQVMPNTLNRLCQWHITHKLGDKVGRIYQDKIAMNKFHSILNNSTLVGEFEHFGESYVDFWKFTYNQLVDEGYVPN